MNRFALGAASGAASLLVAVPLLSQLAGAQSVSSQTATLKTRPVPSQACVQALAAMDGEFLATVDAMIASRKTAIQAHQQALLAAAAISDDTARDAAVKKANDDMRTAMKTAFDTQEKSTTRDALKTACGDAGIGFGARYELGFGRSPGPKGHGFGHRPEKLLTALGMTADELKAALDSGKTIGELAAEKGVTLPPKAEKRVMKFVK